MSRLDQKKKKKCNGRISGHRIIKKTTLSRVTIDSFKGQAEKHHLRRKYLSSPLNVSSSLPSGCG
jgi:hypothetical protein